MRKFVSRCPINNKILKEFNYATDAQVLSQLQLAKKGFDQYKKHTVQQRAEKLNKMQQLINENLNYYAELITLEMGKPINQSLAEVKKSANHCKYYADNIQNILKTESIQTEAQKSMIVYEPLGTIYRINPFNFPFWSICKGIIPIIAGGNGILARPSDSTPQMGVAMEKLFKDAGFNTYEYQNIFSNADQLDLICSSKIVQGVSFTGSSQAGANIAQIAGKHLKKTMLELGGSDPFIVLDDADVDLAVDLGVKSRLFNAGQVCISAKRFIILDSIYNQFVEKLIKRVKAIKIGDPFKPDTELGPLARTDLVENLQRQIKTSISQGGHLLYGGNLAKIPNMENGNFIIPAIIETSGENVINQQETFGPIFGLLRAQNEDEAIKIANESDYGLGGTIISKNIQRAEEIARQIETGTVFINEMTKSDSRVPNGGVKRSGYGRECSYQGVREFTNIKALWVA